MLQKQSKKLLFLGEFLLIAGILYLWWDLLSVIYIYILAALLNPFCSLLEYPVALNITDGVLHFIYDGLTKTPVSFTVHDASEIYLNLILFIALWGALWWYNQKIRLKFFILGLLILYVCHGTILFAYTFSGIHVFAGNIQGPAREEVVALINKTFPIQLNNLLQVIVFHWNTWGWDTIPLLLWLPGIFKVYTEDSEK